MADSFVFRGNGRRVQLRICDFRDMTKEGGPRIIGLRVQSLPISANRSTSYMSAGVQHYHGPDYRAAWAALLAVVGPQEAPAYLTAWAASLPEKETA